MAIRKDHFVPEAYLKNFVNSNGKLFAWKTKYRSVGEKDPAQVCWRDRFYEIAHGDLKRKVGQIDPDFIERFAFKAYEDSIQDFVKMFTCKPEKIPMHFFLLLCQGYILQKVRTPSYRKGVKRIHAEQGVDLVKGAMQKTRANITKDDPRFALVKDKPGFEYYFTDEFWSNLVEEYLTKPIDIRSIQQQSIIDAYTNMGETANLALGRLSMMRFTIYHAPDNAYFITSDNPGFSLIPHETEPTLKAVDFRFRDMLAVLFPISSKQAIFLHFWQEPNTELIDRPVQYYEASFEDMYLMNKDTYNFADEYVFCSDKKYVEWFRDEVTKG